MKLLLKLRMNPSRREIKWEALPVYSEFHLSQWLLHYFHLLKGFLLLEGEEPWSLMTTTISH